MERITDVVDFRSAISARNFETDLISLDGRAAGR
jgi:hypothetical protein